MSTLDLICGVTVLVCLAVCVPGGIVKPAGALAGHLVGLILIGPAVAQLLASLLKTAPSASEIANSVSTITTPSSPLLTASGLAVGLAVAVSTWVGQKLGGLASTIINLVPGLNLLNMGLGAVFGLLLGLVAMVAIVTVLLMVAPGWTQSELPNSFVAREIARPLGQLALSFAPEEVRRALDSWSFSTLA